MVISRKTSRVGENSKLYVKNRSIHMGRSPNILKIPILSVFTYLYWHFSYQTKTTASPTSVFPASHYVTIANANSSSETATCDKGFITWRAGVGMGIEGHPRPQRDNTRILCMMTACIMMKKRKKKKRNMNDRGHRCVICIFIELLIWILICIYICMVELRISF